MSGLRFGIALIVSAGAVFVAGCGGDGGTADVAAAPSDPDAEVTGTLRVFAYEDSVVPELIDPVLEANPGLEIETATFDSNEEAAAKLAGGFEADVVEICLDEMTPLVKQDLLRPIDPKGITAWDEMEFTEAEGIVLDGQTYGVPLSAGLEGVVYNSDEVPEGIDEIADVFDPQFAGRSTIHGNYALLPIAEGALAMGIEDPFAMDAEQLEQTKQYLIDHKDQFRSLWSADSDLVNMFKSGEVVVATAGPLLAKRLQRRRRAGGVVAGQGGHPVVGLRLRAQLEGAEHRRGLRADELPGLARGAGDPRRGRATW